MYVCMIMYGTVRVSKCIGHYNGQDIAEKVLLDKNHESGPVYTVQCTWLQE